MPSGSSLTADQWLLLATVYGPVVVSTSLTYRLVSSQFTRHNKIPQLWSICLPTDADDEILRHRVDTIKKAESEKQAQANSKADQKKALAAAKMQGKDAFEAEKARIAQEKLAIAEAKTQEKLRIAAAKQAEKVRLAAEKKASAAAKRVSHTPSFQRFTSEYNSRLRKSARQLRKMSRACPRDKHVFPPLLLPSL